MFDEQITAFAGLTILVVSFIVGGIAMTAVWSVPHQIVQNSGNENLQITYQTGQQMISTTSDSYDIWNIVKGGLVIVGLPIGGYLAIRTIMNL